jgi:hypothetical protein
MVAGRQREHMRLCAIIQDRRGRNELSELQVRRNFAKTICRSCQNFHGYMRVHHSALAEIEQMRREGKLWELAPRYLRIHLGVFALLWIHGEASGCMRKIRFLTGLYPRCTDTAGLFVGDGWREAYTTILGETSRASRFIHSFRSTSFASGGGLITRVWNEMAASELGSLYRVRVNLVSLRSEF